MGKFMAGAIVISAVLAGAAIYYLQVYAFYEPVKMNGTDDVQMTSLVSQLPEPILYEDYEAIDSESSPIRYRACFTTSMSQALMSETYVAVDYPVPLVGPSWFSCYDAVKIGAALESGEAVAFLGTKDVTYGVDRVVAVYPDGRGFVWNEINACGEKVFDGLSAPEGCPPVPSNIAKSRVNLKPED